MKDYGSGKTKGILSVFDINNPSLGFDLSELYEHDEDPLDLYSQKVERFWNDLDSKSSIFV